MKPKVQWKEKKKTEYIIMSQTQGKSFILVDLSHIFI